LGLHDVVHVSDIPADENIEILTDPETVVATVGVVREEEEPAAVGVDEETPAEPEVIGKGKKEDEGE
ncbi:MAG: 50S ribosomal protein L25, partial [Pyrinomonadaceae bacterium]